MAIYNTKHMKLIEEALEIPHGPDVAPEAYYTGFRDAIYNKLGEETNPNRKEVLNKFAQLLGPNNPSIDEQFEQEGNEKLEKFMEGKDTLETKELLKEIVKNFGRNSESPTSVSMFSDEKDLPIDNEYKAQKK